jgi:transcriptional regulator with XRE-family HTH domain
MKHMLETMLTERLKELQEAKGLTNKDLAKLADIPESTVNRILSGQTDSPNFYSIRDMVEAMDGSLDYVGGIEQDSAPKAQGPHSEDVQALREMVQEKDAEIKRSQKWLFRVYIVVLFLIAVLVGLLVLLLTTLR